MWLVVRVEGRWQEFGWTVPLRRGGMENVRGWAAGG